jgi:hypothetical protein
MFLEREQTARAETQPLWFASFIAGVSAPFAYWLMLLIIEIVTSGSFVKYAALQALAMTAMIGVPVCVIAAFAFGFPFALLLRKLGGLSALNLCAGAAIIGVLVAAGLTKMLMPSNPVDIAIAGLGGAVGLFAGMVFCLVGCIPVRRKTP